MGPCTPHSTRLGTDFSSLDEAVQDAFRDVTTRFVNMYAFVS